MSEEPWDWDVVFALILITVGVLSTLYIVGTGMYFQERFVPAGTVVLIAEIHTGLLVLAFGFFLVRQPRLGYYLLLAGLAAGAALGISYIAEWREGRYVGMSWAFFAYDAAALYGGFRIFRGRKVTF